MDGGDTWHRIGDPRNICLTLQVIDYILGLDEISFTLLN